MTPWESLLQSNNGSSIIKQLVLIAFFILEYIYIYRVFKKGKKHFSKRFDVCLHQSILFSTHLKNFYYIFTSNIYNKIVITIML